MNGNRFVDLIVITVAVLGFLGELSINTYLHPYEQCSRMYEEPNNIVECVWIKENE